MKRKKRPQIQYSFRIKKEDVLRVVRRAEVESWRDECVDLRGQKTKNSYQCGCCSRKWKAEYEPDGCPFCGAGAEDIHPR